jgi:hypothetical protein
MMQKIIILSCLLISVKLYAGKNIGIRLQGMYNQPLAYSKQLGLDELKMQGQFSSSLSIVSDMYTNKQMKINLGIGLMANGYHIQPSSRKADITYWNNFWDPVNNPDTELWDTLYFSKIQNNNRYLSLPVTFSYLPLKSNNFCINATVTYARLLQSTYTNEYYYNDVKFKNTEDVSGITNDNLLNLGLGVKGTIKSFPLWDINIGYQYSLPLLYQQIKYSDMAVHKLNTHTIEVDLLRKWK